MLLKDPTLGQLDALVQVFKETSELDVYDWELGWEKFYANQRSQITLNQLRYLNALHYRKQFMRLKEFFTSIGIPKKV